MDFVPTDLRFVDLTDLRFVPMVRRFDTNPTGLLEGEEAAVVALIQTFATSRRVPYRGRRMAFATIIIIQIRPIFVAATTTKNLRFEVVDFVEAAVEDSSGDVVGAEAAVVDVVRSSSSAIMKKKKA